MRRGPPQTLLEQKRKAWHMTDRDWQITMARGSYQRETGRGCFMVLVVMGLLTVAIVLTLYWI